MTDHYATLGVPKTASADEIKRAYRKLASQHHPDRGGDTAKFQEIEQAYRVLSDPQQRQQYDNPQSNFGGFHFGHDAGTFDFDSIFNMFGARFGHQPRQRSARMTLWVSLADVAAGGRRTISVGTQQGTQTVEIEIPLGIEDGDTVQYQGVAPGGLDLMVSFRIHPNPLWARQGNNLHCEHTVSMWDCILGGETVIRDILGNQLTLTVPPRTQPGTMLRLRGKGLRTRHGQTGDLLVRIQARIPETISEELLDQIAQNRQ